jgi:hypothetical protein
MVLGLVDDASSVALDIKVWNNWITEDLGDRVDKSALY